MAQLHINVGSITVPEMQVQSSDLVEIENDLSQGIVSLSGLLIDEQGRLNMFSGSRSTPTSSATLFGLTDTTNTNPNLSDTSELEGIPIAANSTTGRFSGLTNQKPVSAKAAGILLECLLSGW